VDVTVICYCCSHIHEVRHIFEDIFFPAFWELDTNIYLHVFVFTLRPVCLLAFHSLCLPLPWLTVSACTINWYVPFSFNPPRISWIILWCVLKRNGNASPCFRPFWMWTAPEKYVSTPGHGCLPLSVLCCPV